MTTLEDVNSAHLALKLVFGRIKLVNFRYKSQFLLSECLCVALFFSICKCWNHSIIFSLPFPPALLFPNRFLNQFSLLLLLSFFNPSFFFPFALFLKFFGLFGIFPLFLSLLSNLFFLLFNLLFFFNLLLLLITIPGLLSLLSFRLLNWILVLLYHLEFLILFYNLNIFRCNFRVFNFNFSFFFFVIYFFIIFLFWLMFILLRLIIFFLQSLLDYIPTFTKLWLLQLQFFHFQRLILIDLFPFVFNLFVIIWSIFRVV